MKTGAVVLDVGINVMPGTSLPHALEASAGSGVPETSIVGDVAQKEVRRVASALTPVPGGVGPMTIAALLSNVLLAAKYKAGLARW